MCYTGPTVGQLVPCTQLLQPWIHKDTFLAIQSCDYTRICLHANTTCRGSLVANKSMNNNIMVYSLRAKTPPPVSSTFQTFCPSHTQCAVIPMSLRRVPVRISFMRSTSQQMANWSPALRSCNLWSNKTGVVNSSCNYTRIYFHVIQHAMVYVLQEKHERQHDVGLVRTNPHLCVLHVSNVCTCHPCFRSHLHMCHNTHMR